MAPAVDAQGSLFRNALGTWNGPAFLFGLDERPGGIPDAESGLHRGRIWIFLVVATPLPKEL